MSRRRAAAAGVTALMAVMAAALLFPGPALAAAACPIIDATVPLARVAAATAGQPDEQQLAAYRRALIDPRPGLYGPEVLGLTPGPATDRLILRSLAVARRDGEQAELKRQLRAQIAATTAAFRSFTDFRCDFPIYFADTLGQLDGAGRVVDGQRALVLGIGPLAQERSQISLPVFLTHEFFHRYHFQAAGFSDDLEDRQQIWRNLWAEGLATYMSEVLTPDATATDALMLPKDLAQRAGPFIARMAAELLGGLDGMDEQLFTVYFTSNPRVDRHGLPPRAGYFMGYVVARRLAAQHTPEELAHLQGTQLHGEIEAALRDLAAS
jgi:hypothetical protein